ncbi:MAG: hypothetical protein ACFFDH_10990 [Promethearchaeota archaeon]
METYKVVKEVGLKQIQIGNIGVFAKTDEEVIRLIEIIGIQASSYLISILNKL